MRVEGQAPRWQPSQFLDAADRVFDGPYRRTVILDGTQGLVDKFHGGDGAAVRIFGGEMLRATDSELRTWTGSKDRVDIQAIEVTEPIREEIHAECVHVARFGVVLDIEAHDLVARLFPWPGPLAGMVEQR
nr:hypothetical protein [Pseudomonas aeruginosa]